MNTTTIPAYTQQTEGTQPLPDTVGAGFVEILTRFVPRCSINIIV